MTCFICNYCNRRIQTNNDIYYALDYNYCSHSCRLHHYRRLKNLLYVTERTNIPTYTILPFCSQPKPDIDFNNKSTKTISSFKSIDNLFPLENIDGNTIYRDLSNCQTFIKLPLTFITYFSDLIYHLSNISFI